MRTQILALLLSRVHDYLSFGLRLCPGTQIHFFCSSLFPPLHLNFNEYELVSVLNLPGTFSCCVTEVSDLEIEGNISYSFLSLLPLSCCVRLCPKCSVANCRLWNRTGDEFVAGNIVEIEVHNFMTYTHLKSKPGARLNLVIGPNGTGKSSLVCAIGIGLAGEPSVRIYSTQ